MTKRSRAYFKECKRGKAAIASGGYWFRAKKFKLQTGLTFAEQRKMGSMKKYRDVLKFPIVYDPAPFIPGDKPSTPEEIAEWMNKNWAEEGEKFTAFDGKIIKSNTMEGYTFHVKMPKETLDEIIEHKMNPVNVDAMEFPKAIYSYARRGLWDKSGNPAPPAEFEDHPFT